MTRKPIDRIRRCITTILGLSLPAVLMAAVPSAAQDDGEWTVVTLALDGSWGVGTSEQQGQALASAVRKCSAMSRESDCGAEFTAVRRGWTLGLLCGNHRVLVAAKELVNADREAQFRECDLKTQYEWSLPFCWRVITVDPDGFVTKGTRPYFAKTSPSR
jgi:hypothetical protein